MAKRKEEMTAGGWPCPTFPKGSFLSYEITRQHLCLSLNGINRENGYPSHDSFNSSSPFVGPLTRSNMHLKEVELEGQEASGTFTNQLHMLLPLPGKLKMQNERKRGIFQLAVQAS